jgi:Fur family peroxide stress response transcriptional regulator
MKLRQTAQRRAILDCVRGRKDHPSADDVYACVRAKLPGLSRTTVYRVLDALVRAGILRRVNQPGARARFDARTDRHHHLVCMRCERILDLDGDGLNALALPKIAGFQIEDYSVHFMGVCKSCR